MYVYGGLCFSHYQPGSINRAVWETYALDHYEENVGAGNVKVRVRVRLDNSPWTRLLRASWWGCWQGSGVWRGGRRGGPRGFLFFERPCFKKWVALAFRLEGGSGGEERGVAGKRWIKKTLKKETRIEKGAQRKRKKGKEKRAQQTQVKKKERPRTSKHTP